MSPAPWWSPARHADRRPHLMARNRIMRGLRAWFEAHDFTEVACSALAVSPGNETHLHAFATTSLTIDGHGRPLYLHTSPEFAAKKLLAAGETRIVDFARVFRNRERGPLHHPEFTMIEWYRAGEPWQALIADCADILAEAAEAAGSSRLVWRGKEADPFAEPERLSVAEAFRIHAGIDLMASLGADGATDRDELAARAREAGFRVAPDDGWSDIFSKVLTAAIEPRLGIGRATILHGYPVSEAALARRDAADLRLAERFELYACGVELANAFAELTDPDEQGRRFAADMEAKAAIYGETYPVDQDFLAALAMMPEASGIALGFERLAMLASGARHIEDVIWAPVPE